MEKTILSNEMDNCISLLEQMMKEEKEKVVTPIHNDTVKTNRIHDLIGVIQMIKERKLKQQTNR